MLGVDAGGTFTDVVSVRDGVIEVTKVPSSRTDPAAPVVEGARRLGVEGQTVFNHASTMGLNAVITRRLPKVAFVTTEGHRDMLAAGRVWRPLDGQTDASWRRSFGDAARPLVPRYLRRGVTERMRADGSTLIPLDEDQARAQFEVLQRCAVEGVAICLINAYLAPAHEQRLRAIAHEVLGDIPISISSDVSPLAKEYGRASTTVIDVFMKLMYGGYAEQLDRELTGSGFTGELNFADCAATLMPWREALKEPFKIVFAGPAAGTVSCTRLGAAMGEGNLMCCDVGGTSTDVSLVVEGRPFVENTFELEHDLIINALSTEVSSVGAGGGSIVSISSTGDVRVGPESAGAEPGPACYGWGGELPTVTDACLLMGILDPAGFARGEVQLDAQKAWDAFAALESPLSVEQRIAFAYRIAVNNIAEEVTNIAISHGVDPRDFSLLAYGAAGPMLLPAALELLHVKQVVIPPFPGNFSALGLLSADQVYSDSRSSYVVLGPDAAPQIAALYEEMEAGLRARVGDAGADISIRRSFDGRLYGQSWETPFIAVPDGPITGDTVTGMVDAFQAEYAKRYGNTFPLPVQGVTYRVELIVEAEKVEYVPREPDPDAPAPQALRSIELKFYGDEALRAGEYDRDALSIGSSVTGPAIIREGLSTTFVCPGQVATVGSLGELVVRREEEV